LQAERVLACADYPTLVDAVATYLREAGAADGSRRPVEAALAIAGPITSDRIRMTNHAWQFSAAETRRQIGVRRLILLNDFTALAMSIRYLPRGEFAQIGGGAAHEREAIALIGPGTGLGVSGLIPLSVEGHDYWSPLQGEGGHVTLPLTTQREVRVAEVLLPRFKQISAERLLSGPGLVNIHQALGLLAGRSHPELEPEEISARGLRGDPVCLEVLEIFCALLGTVAGNLALTLGATGGVYIGGGIVPQLGEFFAASSFRSRFEANERHGKYLAAIPVFVIHAQRPAFTGAVRAFIDPGPRLEIIDNS